MLIYIAPTFPRPELAKNISFKFKDLLHLASIFDFKYLSISHIINTILFFIPPNPDKS